MGALYEDVERFFGDIFAYYGRIVARKPWLFVLIPTFICAALGLGCFNLHYETSVSKLYAPIGTKAQQDRDKLSRIFPDFSDTDFYPHQRVGYGSASAMLILYSDVEDAPLTGQGMTEIKRYIDFIKRNISIKDDSFTYRFPDVCAMRDGRCIIEGEQDLQQYFSRECVVKYSESDGWNGSVNIAIHGEASNRVLSKDRNSEQIDQGMSKHRSRSSNCLLPKAFRIGFHLKTNTPANTERSLKWESAFLHHARSLRSQARHIRLSYFASQALHDELYEHVGQDMRLFPATIFIMVVLASFIGAGGNWVSTHVMVAQMGILATLFAILAAFGVLAACGLPFVDVSGVMPFMVIGLGADHMFLLLSAWRQTNIRSPIPDRMAETFRACAISIIIMSLSDMLVYAIGSTSHFLSIQYFCAYMGVALLFCYINMMTFFGGCLALNARRVKESRHCIACIKVKPQEELEVTEGVSKPQLLLCSGHPPRQTGEDDNMCRNFPKALIIKVLLKGYSKTLVLLGYIAYLVLTIRGTSELDVGFILDDVIPKQSAIDEYRETQGKFFDQRDATVQYVFDGEVHYADRAVQRHIKTILDNTQQTAFISKFGRISWLETFLSYASNNSIDFHTNEDFYTALKNDFLPKYPEFKNDIVFFEGNGSVQYSRMYLHAITLTNSTAEKELMLSVRSAVQNSSLPIIVFSSSFIFYEHHVAILKDTLLTVAVTIISMLLIAIMFIPHPVSVTCVTITMVSVVLGILGSLNYISLTLSSVQTQQLLIGVGICLNFSVQISHAFMIATGKSRNERVSVALEKVGGVLLNSSISFIFGIFMLLFGSSFVFISFFKCMSLMIMVSFLHAIVLLPVLLTFIGPRRTMKPRVFLPMSSSRTSLQNGSNQVYNTKVGLTKQDSTGTRHTTVTYLDSMGQVTDSPPPSASPYSAYSSSPLIMTSAGWATLTPPRKYTPPMDKLASALNDVNPDRNTPGSTSRTTAFTMTPIPSISMDSMADEDGVDQEEGATKQNETEFH